ncbi:mandelate racemase/muconate lactonizing enzyme family protein [Streptomyces angustmyceticus]|uniref:mandelate racemase/muconate lactonizing enzyme family protein n=1 Tax=Streptomyces angustmyceticus TaxID=285578 RepID=UPI003D8F60FB
MKFHHHIVSARLTHPFVSNTGVTTEVRQSVVEVSWQGLTGRGTARAAPDAVDACAEVLQDAASPHELRRIMGALAEAGIEPAARSAVDMALHDLLGKACGQPLHHLLGLAGMPLPPTALSIGACPDDELLSVGRSLAHWPVLKLKFTPDDDGRRVRVLRSVYEGRIRVDANGSWEPAQAVRVARELAGYDVEMLEQPVPPRDLDALRFVSEHAPLPVYADEDCHGPDDVLRLRRRVSGINVKLVKCGGLLAAQETIALARRAGLGVMLGCKLESSLGVTAMAQLGALADHLDLDGHVGLANDPFTGAEVTAGAVTLPAGPGLGVTTKQTNDGEK